MPVEDTMIVVGWRPDSQYGQIMYVLESQHPRFPPGHRFDWGFAGTIALEGYTLVINPMTDDLIKGSRSEIVKGIRARSGISITSVNVYRDSISSSSSISKSSTLSKLSILWESDE